MQSFKSEIFDCVKAMLCESENEGDIEAINFWQKLQERTNSTTDKKTLNSIRLEAVERIAQDEQAYEFVNQVATLSNQLTAKERKNLLAEFDRIDAEQAKK